MCQNQGILNEKEVVSFKRMTNDEEVQRMKAKERGRRVLGRAGVRRGKYRLKVECLRDFSSNLVKKSLKPDTRLRNMER